MSDESTTEFDNAVDISFYPISTQELNRRAEQNIEEFNDLLNGLSSTEDKKKNLWRQIYENAIFDRKNAYLMFADLYSQVSGQADKHAIHGPVLSKYIERMNKCNDQLIKLATLVSDAINEDIEDQWDEDKMYDMLNE